MMTPKLTENEQADILEKYVFECRDGDGERVGLPLADLVKSNTRFLSSQLKPLQARIKALETELQTLRQEKSAIQYHGVFQRAIKYERGNIVTHDGSAWIKVGDLKGAPGTCDSWQLFVKKGRDAR